MASGKCVFFDFDGVIVDTYSSSFAAAALMHPGLTEKKHRALFDGNIFEAHESAIEHTDDCRHDLDYYAFYTPHMKEHSRFITGMGESVRKLSEEYPLFIISSSRSSLIERFLEEHALNDCFAEILGDDVHARKDEKVRMLLEKHAINPANSVFVTDTLGDMREARSVGVGSIGVSWGFQSKGNLEKGNPFRIVDTPDALPEAVRDYFG